MRSGVSISARWAKGKDDGMQGIGAEEVQEQLAAGQDSGDDEVHQAETEPGGAQDGEQ